MSQARRSPLLAPTLILATLALVSAVQDIDAEALRAAVALPVLLLAPGYALLGAAFGFPVRLDGANQLGLAAMSSLALVALVAIGLDAMDIRIQGDSVLVGLQVVSGGLVALGLLRTLARRRSPEPEERVGLGTRYGGLLATVGALGLIAGVVGLGLTVLPRAAAETFTEVQLTGGWERLGSQVRPSAREPVRVPLRIHNRSDRARSYTVTPVLERTNSPLSSFPAWAPRTVRIGPDASWSGAVSGPPPLVGCSRRLSITVRPTDGGSGPISLIVWFQGARALCEDPPVAPPE